MKNNREQQRSGAIVEYSSPADLTALFNFTSVSGCKKPAVYPDRGGKWKSKPANKTMFSAYAVHRPISNR